LIISETGERLTIQNWYSSADHQLIQIEFADGTAWTRAEINAMSPVLRGADGGDTITGFANQNNILIGGNGNDVLRGISGNNIFKGGQGENLKVGGNGRNTYKWELGSGGDTINDFATNKDHNGWGGTLKIGEGVDPAGITTAREGNNLILTIGETGEQLTIYRWYSGTNWQLRRIEFADGSYWDRSYGQSVEAFFEELATQAAPMMAASGLLMSQGAGTCFFHFDAQLFTAHADTLAANPAESNSSNMFDQAEIDIALASLQMETDSGMVCSTGNTGSTMENNSVLAVSSGIYTNVIVEPFSSQMK